MKVKALFAAGFFTAVTGMTVVGCKPKTTSQKIEDKVEDAQHAVGQGVERAGENIQDATKK